MNEYKKDLISSMGLITATLICKNAWNLNRNQQNSISQTNTRKVIGKELGIQYSKTTLTTFNFSGKQFIMLLTPIIFNTTTNLH